MEIITKFQEKDFKGCGQIVVRTNKSEIKDDSFLTTIMYKIGWFAIDVTGYDKNIKKYALIALSDGMIYELKENLKKMVEFLNDKGLYRPATKEEIIRVATYQGNRFHILSK